MRYEVCGHSSRGNSQSKPSVHGTHNGEAGRQARKTRKTRSTRRTSKTRARNGVTHKTRQQLEIRRAAPPPVLPSPARHRKLDRPFRHGLQVAVLVAAVPAGSRADVIDFGARLDDVLQVVLVPVEICGKSSACSEHPNSTVTTRSRKNHCLICVLQVNRKTGKQRHYMHSQFASHLCSSGRSVGLMPVGGS